MIAREGLTAFRMGHKESADHFNFEVADWHTYFVAGHVSAAAVWVHNAGCGDRVLDIGSGRRPQGTPGVGNIDVRIWPGAPKPDVIATGTRLPFKSEVFDEVIMRAPHTHMVARGNADLIAAEAHRVLKPGGTMRLQNIGDLHDPTTGTFVAGADIVRAFERAFGRNVVDMGGESASGMLRELVIRR